MAISKEAIIIISLVLLVAVNAPAAPSVSPGGNGSLPKGIRNNNPLNIRISNSNWMGKIPLNQNTDGDFEQFESMVYGIRAAFVLLKNYYNNYNLKTIRDIISRWAPSSENDTTGYINSVSNYMGIPSTRQLQISQFPVLFKAMAIMEVGQQGASLISQNQINQAWAIS